MIITNIDVFVLAFGLAMTAGAGLVYKLCFRNPTYTPDSEDKAMLSTSMTLAFLAYGTFFWNVFTQ